MRKHIRRMVMKAFRNDISPDYDTNEFVEIFNNLETMKKFYPETYQAYNNTRSGIRECKSELHNEFIDMEIIHVGYASEDKKAIVIEVTGNACSADGYCILKPTIQNRAGKKLESVATDNFLGNCQHASIYVPLSQTDGEPQDLDLVTFAYTVDDQIIQYTSRMNLSPYILDFTAEFTVEHPKIQRTVAKDGLKPTDINICYLLKLTNTDYYYSKSELTDNNLFIPGKGQIKVEGINITSIQNVSLSAENAAHTKRYHTSAGDGVTLLDNQTIAWDISDNWGFPYQTLLVDIYEYITYTLTITANCQGQLATFVITNEEETSDAMNKKQIEQIHIYRDCFAKGTEILLSDGTKRRVEELKKGDRLKSQDGRNAEIADIAGQASTQLIVHIQTESGGELFLTECHPVVTDQGLRCAIRLENGDTLMTIDGPERIRQVCAIPEGEARCYSMTLTDSTQRIYANGILTADAVAERTEAEKELSEKYQIPERWRQDYEGWKARNRGEHA